MRDTCETRDDYAEGHPVGAEVEGRVGRDGLRSVGSIIGLDGFDTLFTRRLEQCAFYEPLRVFVWEISLENSLGHMLGKRMLMSSSSSSVESLGTILRAAEHIIVEGTCVRGGYWSTSLSRVAFSIAYGERLVIWKKQKNQIDWSHPRPLVPKRLGCAFQRRLS